MADERTLKPKSFRIDDETADRFKEIAGNIGGNQQETLAKLIEAWEFQNGKAVLTDKKADIEQFEKYVTALTRMFMGSLEDNQNITETVRTEFEAVLKSKDTTIQELQVQLAGARQLKEEAVKHAKDYADENTELKRTIDSLNKKFDSRVGDLQAMLADKESLNKALTDSCNELKKKVDGMAAEREEMDTLKKDAANAAVERESLQHKIEETQQSIKKMEEQHSIDLERIRKEMQIEQERSVLALEKEHQDQMQKLKEKKQEEIDRYQQKYLELLERLGGVEKMEDNVLNKTK